MWYPILVAAHADEFFGAVVIRSYLGIADGPVVTETVAARGFKIHVRKTPREPPPVQSLSADDSSAYPHERFSRICRVRMLSVFDVEVTAEFACCVLHPLIVTFPTGRAEPTIHRLKRP